MDADIKTAVCTEYERLLKESHQALSEYADLARRNDMPTRFGGCHARM
jgi:hypothetical protein